MKLLYTRAKPVSRGLPCWTVYVLLCALLSYAADVTVEGTLPLQFTGTEGGPFIPQFHVPRSEAATSATSTQTTTATAATTNYHYPTTARTLAATMVSGSRPGMRLLMHAPTKHARLLVEQRAGQTTTMAADHLVVRLQPTARTRDLQAILQAENCTILRPLHTRGNYLISVPGDPLDGLDTIANRLRAYRHTIASVSPDFLVTATAIPDDPRFSEQYGLHNTGQTGGLADADIDAPEAWDITTGSATIRVGIIDTGIDYNHPDLAANVWTNPGEIPGNNIDDDANGFVDDIHGWNFARDTADPLDDNHHGSHVAGILGAIGNNNLGVAGTTRHVSMVAIKFLDSRGNGFLSDSVDAVHYARTVNCHIINNSWRGFNDQPGLEEALIAARDEGILVINAAGNENGRNIDLLPVYPASYGLSNFLNVAATNDDDLLASFSSIGPNKVALAAPGDKILSTEPGNVGTGGTTYGYRTLSGTSMSTPMVSGAAVMLLTHLPTLTPPQAINRLMATTDRLPTLAGKTFSGGRLNIHRALTEPPPQQLILTNTTPAAIDWSTAIFSSWMAFDQATGTLDPGQSITLTIAATPDAALLANGTYDTTAELFVNGTPHLTKPITLTVEDGLSGLLTVTPNEPFTSNGPQLGPFAPSMKSYQLTNDGDAPITVDITETEDWLELTDTSISLSAGQSQAVQVKLAATALTPGTYTATVAFTNTTNSRGTTSRDITLQVTTPGVIAVTPAEPRTHSGLQGGPFLPASTTYSITNTGESFLEWHVTSDVSWITVPQIIHLLDGGSTVTAAVSHNATANTLAIGTHTATLTFTNVTNGMGTTTRPLLLQVLAPGQIAISPLDPVPFAGLQAGPFAPASQDLTIHNIGDAQVSWEITNAPDWLSLNAQAGALGPRSDYTLSVSLNTASIPIGTGTYTATLQITNLTNDRGTTTYPIPLRILTPALLEIHSDRDYQARGTIGDTASPADVTWYATNLGQVPLPLRITTSQPWLITASTELQLPAGQSLPITFALSESHLLAPGTHHATISFHNDATDQLAITRNATIQMYAPIGSLIYDLTIQGRLLAPTPASYRRSGYLVYDQASQRMQALITWQDDLLNPLYTIEDWTDTLSVQQAFVDKQWAVSFFSNLSVDDRPTGIASWDSRLMEGRSRTLTIADGLAKQVTWYYRGNLLQLDATQGTALDARIYARLDQTRTRATNNASLNLTATVAGLANELETAGAAYAQSLPASSADPIFSPPPPSIRIYDLAATLKTNTPTGKTYQTRRGYLVTGRDTFDATLILYSYGRAGKFYTTQDVQTAVHDITIGTRQYTHLAILQASDLLPTEFLQVIHLQGITHPNQNLGTGQLEDLPRYLRGSWWQDDSSLATHTNGKLYIRLDTIKTRQANQGNIDRTTAVNQLVNLLIDAGWQPALP